MHFMYQGVISQQKKKKYIYIYIYTSRSTKFMFGQVVVEIGSLDYCRLPTYVTGAKVKSINQYQFLYIYIYI